MAKLVRDLSDGELIEALDDMAGRHRALLATMVEHLVEVERRKLHLALGYSSLYTYATSRLQLSEHEAYLRISAARVAGKRPGVVAGLEEGSLSLSTVKVLAPHLDAHPQLLTQARGKSKRQVERLVAETAKAAPPRSDLQLRPLAGGRVELACVVSAETASLLEEALDLSLHDNPDRSVEHVLARALRLLVAKKNKPRGSVPARSERAVEGKKQCAFVGRDGHVCGETRFLQLDHVRPRAAGGSDETGNLRWLCGAHNRYEAERKLGTGRVTYQRLRGQLERDLVKALTTLGYTRDEAAPATRSVLAGRTDLELEPALREALIRLAPASASASRVASVPAGR